MGDNRTMEEIKTMCDKACEILQRTNDGDSLSPQHLKLTELAVNGYLSEKGIQAFEELYQSVIGGIYAKPYLHNIEHITNDHEGYIYYKGINVEHYDHDYIGTEDAKNSLMELKKRCEFLDCRNVPVSNSSVIWGWDRYADEYGGEKLKELDALLGNQAKGLQYSKVVLYNSCREFSYFVCGKPDLEEIRKHPVTKEMIDRYFDNEFIIKTETYIYGRRVSNNLIPLDLIMYKAEIESLLPSCHNYLQKHNKLHEIIEKNSYMTDFAEGHEKATTLDGLLNSPGRSLQYSKIELWANDSHTSFFVCGTPTIDEIMEYPDSKRLASIHGNDFYITAVTISYGHGEPLSNEEIPCQTEVEAFLTSIHDYQDYDYFKDHNLMREIDWKRYEPEYELNEHGIAEFDDEREDEDEYEL